MSLNRILAVALASSLAASAAAATSSLPALSAVQIVEKNAQARGGLSAWRATTTVVFTGKMGAGASRYMTVSTRGTMQTKQRQEAQLPYVLEYKRPFKTRLELEFGGERAVQVYDGASGWKLRPYLGRSSWDVFSSDELKQASFEPGIDGYLLDAAAKGSQVELEGTERIEDRDCYRLKVTLKNAQVHHVWVDGKSFLDIRVEGDQRRLDGRPRTVYIDQREFKAEQGLMIPHVLETSVQGFNRSEKIVIESVKVNAPLNDAQFTKPS
jgi:outer membrane lipoprotein-sorting protein